MSKHHRFSIQSNVTGEVAPGAHRTGGDPRAFGFVKAAYGVNETIDLLSIGRSSLYAAVNRGELTPVKFGKKTLFYAADLAAFLTRLREHAIQSD
jgi:excisionase family DNA binding protein